MGPQSRASLVLSLTLTLGAGCGGESQQAAGSPLGTGGSSPPSLARRGDPAELMQAGLDFLELGNAPRARDSFLEVLAIDKDHAEAQHFLGRTLMGMSRVNATHEGGTGSVGLSVDSAVQKQGVAALRRASELAPLDADYHYWLGRGLHLMGDNAAAVQALTQATLLDTTHGLAFKRLGITHLDAGEPEQALPSFLAAERLLPDDPGPAFQVGNLLLEEDPEGARDAYLRAIQADVSFAGAYNGLIGVLSRLQDPAGSARAAEDFARWTNFEARLQGLLVRAQNLTGDVDAQLDVAEALMEKADWLGAREYFMRTILLDASNAYAHIQLGILNQGLGEASLALKHFEETLHLTPEAVEPRIRLLAICQALGHTERLGELLEYFDAEQENLSAANRVRMADTLREAGLGSAAEQHYRAILAKYPANVGAQTGLDALTAAKAPK